MAYANFSEALMQAKRASQLRGIPFSTADVRNLQSGYMEGAAERANAERSMSLAERSLASQQQNWTDTLAQEKELAGLSREQSQNMFNAQMEAQDKAASKQLMGSGLSTGASLGGAYLLSGAGNVAGMTASQAALAGGEASPILASMGANTAQVTASPAIAAGGTGAASIGGAGSAAISAAPYAAAGYLAAKEGGRQLEKISGEGTIGAGIGRTIQDPLTSPSQAAVNEFFPDNDLKTVANVAEDVFNPLGYALEKIGVSGTVICTELNRQGLLPDEIMNYDSEYRKRYISDTEYMGYRILAVPIVWLLRKSALFTRYFSPIAISTATEMASRVNVHINGTMKGKAVLAVMIPVCRRVGRFMESLGYSLPDLPKKDDGPKNLPPQRKGFGVPS